MMHLGMPCGETCGHAMRGFDQVRMFAEPVLATILKPGGPRLDRRKLTSYMLIDMMLWHGWGRYKEAEERQKTTRKVHIMPALIIAMDVASISHVSPAMAGMACTFPCQASRAWLLQEQMQR